MGLLGWLFGGHNKEQHGNVDHGMHKQAKDPVCGMNVEPEKAAATSVYDGTSYYFCAVGCKKAFDENPAKYLGASAPMAASAHAGKHGCCG